MLAQQRHREILGLIEDTGSARVAELAQQLDVTEETIRRDLRKLNEQGKLIRAHGGAMAAQPDAGRIELPFDTRRQTRLSQKRAIAAAAAERIQENQVIALDASTTACELAKVLPDFSLTVLTNSVVIAASLVDRPNVEVVVAGGVLDRASLSLGGSLTLEAFERFNVCSLFLSCRGVDPERGLTEASDPHAQFKRRAMGLAQQTVLLADSDKLGLRSSVYFAKLSEVDVMITDGEADDAKLEPYRVEGLQIVRAETGAKKLAADERG